MGILKHPLAVNFRICYYFYLINSGEIEHEKNFYHFTSGGFYYVQLYH